MLAALILDEVMAYSRAFSRKIGYVFHTGSIRLTALTGSAATEIKGETTHREFKLHRNGGYIAKDNDINDFNDTRLCVVDEISFADHDRVLSRLSDHLIMFTQCTERTFGSMPIVFLGDFCQLEAIGGNSIISHPNSVYWEQSLTSMVELKGTHRYSKCDMLQKIMPGLRDNGMSKEVRAIFQSRVVDGVNVKLPNIAETKFATFHNKNKCDYNDAVFLSYLKEHHSDCNKNDIPKTAIVIKQTPSWTKSKQLLSFGQRKTLFENCSDADVVDAHGSRHCDPMLKLYYGCQMMGTSNDDVRNGVSNGTTCVFKKVVFKEGKRPTPMKLNNLWVYAIDSIDVDHLLMVWYDSRFEGRFKVKPRHGIFQLKFPIVEDGIKMKVQTSINFYHLPLLVNHATTGHKLQGKSMDALIIAEWSRMKNWAYVVLSRVRSLAGLYLLSPIPDDIDFLPDPRYVDMMNRLRSRKETILRTYNDEFVFDLHEIFAFPK